MKSFFNVTPLERVFEYIDTFHVVGTETVALQNATGRVLASDIVADIDLPGFARSTMDGYAVRASTTFGASEGNPAYLTIRGHIAMGEIPEISIKTGEAIRIATGGMLPQGADAVVMIEHAAECDETTLEVYKSIAPGTHVLAPDEDIKRGEIQLKAGKPLRPQDTGLLAALGRSRVAVRRRPVVAVISTGDELVSIDTDPAPGQVRDINTYTLSGFVSAMGAVPEPYGIVTDDFDALLSACTRAVAESDMILVSGGSSVGMRDLTTDVIAALPDAEILVHGIPVSPGKPTILARIGGKSFWGLPGHVTSAMVIFDRVVRPFLEALSGRDLSVNREHRIPAVLTRNLASAQGRIDFVRVRLIRQDNGYAAEPIPGKSGLIHTMIRADGLIEIDMNTEGLEKGTPVSVIPLA